MTRVARCIRGAAIAGALTLWTAAASAQTFEGSAATIGTQWKVSDANLASYLGSGYRVAAVTQQLTASDRGVVNLTSYFLQKEASFVRCNELTIPAPAAPAKAPATAKGKEKETRPASKQVSPTVVLGCAEAVTPAPVPFTTRPVAGLETIVPGQ